MLERVGGVGALVARGALGLLCLAVPTSAAESVGSGIVVEASIEAKGERVYDVSLLPEQVAHVEVTYLGLDIELEVRAPTGAVLARIDDARVREPVEAFTWIAEARGLYTVIVRERSGRSGGRFAMTMDAARPRVPADQLAIEAQRAFTEAAGEADRARAGSEAGSRERAVLVYDRAAALWEEAGNARLRARALIAGGSAGWTRDPHAGLARCEAALRLAQDGNDLPQEAGALICLAEANYSIALQDEAIEAAQQALEVARDGGIPFRESEALLDLATVHYARLERDLARTLYEEAVGVSREIGDEEVLGVGLSSLAALLNDEGDAQGAHDLLREALVVHRAAGNVAAQVNAMINTTFSLSQLGDHDDAMKLASECVRLARMTGASLNEVYCLRHASAIAADQGDWTAAIAAAREALAVARRAQAPREERLANDSLAYACFKAGRLPEALQATHAAIEVSRRTGVAPAGFSLLNLCRLREAAGEPEEAAARCAEALEVIRSAGPPRLEAFGSYLLARVERRRDRLDAARRHAERALELLEERRAQIRRTDWRASFVESHQELDEFYVDLMIEVAVREQRPVDVAQAFDAAERARTRALRDVIMESRLAGRKGVDARLLARERLLRHRVAREVETSLRQTPGATSGPAARERLESLEKELREVEGEIRRLTPRYADLNDSAILGVAHLRESELDADSVLLAFATGEDRTAMWVVTADELEMHVLPGRAKLRGLVEAVYTSHSKPRARASAAVRELSRLVLDPVRSPLRPRILVIADGPLHYLPFGALPDARGGILLDRHEIVLLPSVSTVRWLQQPAAGPGASRTLAVLADPVFHAVDERIVGGTRPAAASARSTTERAARDFGGLEGLARLPLTRREATRIAGLVGAPSDAMLALDFDANLQTTREGKLGDYRFVHFATHGYLNPSRPDLSGLVLSLFDARGRPQDGFLSAPDAFNLDLSADVVVLSACRTALGKQVRGEGLMGLPQAFMYAGARSVVSSLWSVDDAATAVLMERFYQGLLAREPLRPAAALRAAQAYVRSRPQWRHPYYWAAFQLQGDWKARPARPEAR